MIHKNDERVFRCVEISCYVGFFIVACILKARRHDAWPYFMPLTFFALGTLGIVVMARFFIYEKPDQLWDRTRARFISLSGPTKVTLAIGFAMCVPMLVLGILGFFSPQLMNRAIIVISPMRFILS